MTDKRRAPERFHGRGHLLPDNVAAHDWRPDKRPHRLNVRVSADLLAALRTEAEARGMTLSGVIRLSLAAGVESIRDARAVRDALAGLDPEADG